jgi:hypothetical protein
MTKARRYRKRFFKRKYPKYKRKTRGMQRIKSVRWPARNIGGDRAYCKLRYTKGAEFPIPIGQYYTAQNQAIAIGASTPGALSSCTLAGVMGETPNLSTMGALYTKYRIRGIKLRLTYWQTGGAPAFLYANATPDQGYVDGTSTAPNPDFILPSIAVTPEQRWSKYRVCQATAAGGRATSLSVYYSVNRVQGPDAIVKNDLEYTGDMLPASPYFATGSGDTNRPARSPWMQFGIGTLANNVTTAATHITGVLKVDQTVYCEFFGKRAQTS